MTPDEHVGAIMLLAEELASAVLMHAQKRSAGDTSAAEGLSQTVRSILDQIDFHTKTLREQLL